MRRATGLVLAALLVFLAACGRPAYPHVSLVEPGAAAPAPNPDKPRKLPLRIAIAAVISPQATLDAYGPLLDYLSAKLDRSVQLLQRTTYAEITELIRAGGADIAFVCGGAYVEGQRDFGMELLVAPQVRGATIYYSYIIVARDATAQSLADLRGRTFAFSDPLSNSGHLAPKWLLAQIGETPESFFASTLFTYSHDNSIRAVADHLADGAAVDSLVYDYTIARQPTYSARTRVIDKLGPFGIPPVVVHPNLDPALKAQLRAVLLDMAGDPAGRAALDTLMVDRFVMVDDSAYDSIRSIAAILRGWNETP
ncbi:MAG: phosphate/phosphite/phosphonate ABC transporter substrate-binding protein [Ardenticatenaceae bacterium]|nr:phosphate/phosphite/phosphonate ABC transporter substrate-binding protein [Ardenticatenaceae bacterium]HBY93631.1 phosphate/phosphite/phosphonate ABC transporter substrate-binding protein [Chloroflexota bacterium]